MREQLCEKLAWTEHDHAAAAIASLASELATEDARADESARWPAELWELLTADGAPRWSLPEEFGGAACPRPLLVQRYATLAGGSLTAVFILSQHDAAVRRLVAGTHTETARRWLRAIGAGRAFATVGISHLTTSRRLGAQAVRAEEVAPGMYRLGGATPWVTAAARADLFVTGAALDDGRQMLIALPADRPGVSVRAQFHLAALEASCTAEVTLEDVQVDVSDLLAGPAADIMAHPGAVGTAGLETSALALGQARAALAALVTMAPDRIELTEPLEVLCENWQSSWRALASVARGERDAVSATQLRAQANALALRSTQAYLTACKGTGFLRSEPAQRWARQALFFLVWSCPAPIAQAAIRDLAGLCPA
jgi:alkylation response protein AidB-like acyl-CoA dehydrogenase